MQALLTHRRDASGRNWLSSFSQWKIHQNVALHMAVIDVQSRTHKAACWQTLRGPKSNARRPQETQTLFIPKGTLFYHRLTRPDLIFKKPWIICAFLSTFNSSVLNVCAVNSTRIWPKHLECNKLSLQQNPIFAPSASAQQSHRAIVVLSKWCSRLKTIWKWTASLLIRKSILPKNKWKPEIQKGDLVIGFG